MREPYNRLPILGKAGCKALHRAPSCLIYVRPLQTCKHTLPGWEISFRRSSNRCYWNNSFRNPIGFRLWVKEGTRIVKTRNISNWQSRNRYNYLLQYHLIFICKYRKNLLSSQKVGNVSEKTLKEYIENQGWNFVQHIKSGWLKET